MCLIKHLFTGLWQFMWVSGQHSEVFNNGLEVSGLSQHGNFTDLRKEVNATLL